MSTGVQHQERVPMNLKKQLALAVRNIQWSYAIFWSISTRQPGVLEWGDGYYNGDIKTRKTVQAVELNTDQLSLQRSEQLRQLYESLSAGESSPQAKRPSAALSPEDLTDTEWYYLVCMSFVFNIGQGLPGRTLSSGQPVWLCNAHCADSKVFGRSLLAKSASIQTVVCFPFSGGVVELSVTDLVTFRFSLLFLPIVSNRSIQIDGMNNDLTCPALDPLILATKLSPILGCEQLETVSPDDSPDGLEPKQSRENSLLIEGINGGASQVQSWQFMDEEFSNCVHHSLNSSDCISQTIADHRKAVPLCQGKNDNGLQDVEECNQTKLTSFDRQNDDRLFHEVLSALFKSSHPLILGPQWQKNGLVKPQKETDETPQKLLKKILFSVPHMHDRGLIESPETNAIRDAAWRPEADEICRNHVLSEWKRRDKINERLMILKSLVPANNKADKVSILDVTIEYVQALERRVAELESCRKLEARTKIDKRKAYDLVDKADQEIGYVASKDGSTDNVTISMNNKELLIEFNILNLDCHSVQSSTTEGILSLTIKSKYKGSSVAKAGPIEQALQRIAGKC
ncbi:hypothetical protein V6Z11_A08G211900 [Gossypium hirsutum]